MQAVSVAPASFQNRKSLPKAWQGLRDEQLSEAAGIPKCVFVHASGKMPAALLQPSLSCRLTLVDAAAMRNACKLAFHSAVYLVGTVETVDRHIPEESNLQGSLVVPRPTRELSRWHKLG